MGCFAYHPIWKVSHESEIEARLWRQFEDTHNQGSQNALPVEYVVPWI